MTQQQYIISRKLNILELGQVLGNISEACRKLGVSRQHYYDIKRAIEEGGLEGLLEKSRRVPRIGNRVALEIEQKLLDYSLEFPTHGPSQDSERTQAARDTDKPRWSKECLAPSRYTDQSITFKKA